MGTDGSPGQEDISRDAVEPIVRDVVDEELHAYEQQTALVVAAIVGGGLMLTFAFGMAGIALLAPDAATVLAALGILGAILFAGGVLLAARR